MPAAFASFVWTYPGSPSWTAPGLRVLVHAHNNFLAARGTLVLTGVGHTVARLLDITGLDEALFVADGLHQPRRTRHLASVEEAAEDAATG